MNPRWNTVDPKIELIDKNVQFKLIFRKIKEGINGQKKYSQEGEPTGFFKRSV